MNIWKYGRIYNLVQIGQKKKRRPLKRRNARFRQTLNERAQNMFDNPTTQESFIESCLSDLKFASRRQVIIDHYIVDFLLPGKLIIEADGACHDNFKQQHYDTVRDNYLAYKGYKMLHIHWSTKSLDIKEKIHQFVMAHSGVIRETGSERHSGSDNHLAGTNLLSGNLTA